MRLKDFDDIMATIKATPHCDVATALMIANNAPNIDPIKAAGGCYCQECKWYEDNGVCGWTSTNSTKNLRDADDFCSDGEPKGG